MIHEFFQTNRSMDMVYSVEDLASLAYPGDREMHTFRYYWNTITTSMQDKINDKTLANMLVKKLEASQELKEDIAHYYRKREGDPDHTYKYLRECMDVCIKRKMEKKNRDQRVDVLKKGGKGIPAAPGPVPKAKAKAKAKGKPGGASTSMGDQARTRAQSVGGGGGYTGKRYCYWFNHGTCSRGNDCYFVHEKVSAEEAAKIPRPARSPSPGGKRKGKGKNGGDGGKAKVKAKVKIKGKEKVKMVRPGGKAMACDGVRPSSRLRDVPMGTIVDFPTSLRMR